MFVGLGVAQMLCQNYFFIWVGAYSIKGTHVWYYKYGQISVAGEVIVPKEEATADLIWLSKHDVNDKLPCKYLVLGPWIKAFINSGLPNFYILHFWIKFILA